MQHTKSTLFICIFLLTLFSCKKDNESGETFPKVHVYSNYNSTGHLDSQTTYYYDKDGRTSRTESLNRGYYTFEYLSNKVVVKFFNTSNYLMNTETYTLHNGLADSCISSDGDTTTYEYDDNGYQIKMSIKGSYTFINKIKDGNEVMSILKFPGGQIDTSVYQYYDKPNTIGLQNMGCTYLGKQNKNLVKTVTASNDYLENYEYEFDSQNRVSNKIEVFSNSKYSNTYSYY